MKKMLKIDPFDLYEAAVIDAPSDVRLFRRFYLEINGSYPETYREDFAGTFKHAVEWVKCNRRNRSWAIDLDKNPLQYGIKKHLSQVSEEQKSRIQVLRQDVRKGISRKVNFITAMNFSYCIFKERKDLKKYFKEVCGSLENKGLFLIDIMGGSQMLEASEDRRVIPKSRELPRLTYYWEQFNFDGFTNEAKFGIHFKVGKSKRRLKNVFTYDWRLWSLPELKDLMLECGFKKTYVYPEGTYRDGSGNGVFKRRKFEADCMVWVTYLIGEK